MRKRKSPKLEWVKAPDIKKRVLHLIKALNLDWIHTTRIYCYRSRSSTSHAYARIWGLSRIWQLALSSKPSYIIEVLSERFDRLKPLEKDRVLIHELAHIPRNFSGSLLAHTRVRGKRNFRDKVEELFAQYQRVKR